MMYRNKTENGCASRMQVSSEKWCSFRTGACCSIYASMSVSTRICTSERQRSYIDPAFQKNASLLQNFNMLKFCIEKL